MELGAQGITDLYTFLSSRLNNPAWDPQLVTRLINAQETYFQLSFYSVITTPAPRYCHWMSLWSWPCDSWPRKCSQKNISKWQGKVKNYWSMHQLSSSFCRYCQLCEALVISLNISSCVRRILEHRRTKIFTRIPANSEQMNSVHGVARSFADDWIYCPNITKNQLGSEVRTTTISAPEIQA
jgi:hypothetical protein